MSVWNCCARESFRQSDISKWDAFFAEEPTLISTNKTESFLNIPGYQRCQHRDRPEWRSSFLLTESVTECANNREKLSISIYESWDNTDALDSVAQARKCLRPNTSSLYLVSAPEKKIVLTDIDGQRSDKLSLNRMKFESSSNQTQATEVFFFLDDDKEKQERQEEWRDY